MFGKMFNSRKLGNKLQSDVIIYKSSWCPTTVQLHTVGMLDSSPFSNLSVALVCAFVFVQKTYTHACTHTHRRMGRGWAFCSLLESNSSRCLFN